MNLVSKTKNLKRTILLHSFTWIFFICIGLIPFFQSQYRFSIDFLVEWISFIILFYANYFYLIPKLIYKKKYFLYISLIFGIIISFAYIKYQFFIYDFHEPKPPKIFDNLGNEIIVNKMHFKEPPLFFKVVLLFPYITIVFISLTIKTLSEYYINQKNILLAETERKTTELIYLRKQINPHFLFNSLNSIYSLANKKSDLVTDAIVTLSELMRYMLYETNNKSVLLEKEINYIKNYIDLQKLRLNDIENIHLNIHGNTQNKFIEPLLLISFIENAFKYGTDYRGASHVKIKIVIKENTLDFFVENKVEKTNIDTENSGIGISNIESRLQLLYPNAHTLIITEERSMYSVFLSLKLNQMQLL